MITSLQFFMSELYKIYLSQNNNVISLKIHYVSVSEDIHD